MIYVSPPPPDWTASIHLDDPENYVFDTNRPHIYFAVLSVIFSFLVHITVNPRGVSPQYMFLDCKLQKDQVTFQSIQIVTHTQYVIYLDWNENCADIYGHNIYYYNNKVYTFRECFALKQTVRLLSVKFKSWSRKRTQPRNTNNSECVSSPVSNVNFTTDATWSTSCAWY